MSQPSKPKRRLFDSPWYWLHLFCIASLIGLTIVRPKFVERQASFERKFQGRQRALLQKAGREPNTPLSTPEDHNFDLMPLYCLLGFGAALSWFNLWRTHFRGAKAPRAPVTSGEGAKS